MLNKENLSKSFLQEKCNSFVVLKTYYSNHCVENCGGDEKLNLIIFPFFGA
jgi:hypothetical protein